MYNTEWIFIYLQHAGESPPVPIRGLSKKGNEGEEEDEGEDVEQLANEKLNIHDLMPHVDISSHITDSLLSELADRNWKVSLFLFVTSCFRFLEYGCALEVDYSDGNLLCTLVYKLRKKREKSLNM